MSSETAELLLEVMFGKLYKHLKFEVHENDLDVELLIKDLREDVLRALEIAREGMYSQGRKDAMRDCEKNQCQKFEKLKNVRQQTAEKIFEELEETLPVASRQPVFKKIKSRWVGHKQ